MQIAGRKIGFDCPPLVIAEIGINHGGCLETAKQMAFAAFQAGCEMVKHQTHIVEDEMTEEAKQIFPPNADMSIWDVMIENSLSREQEKAFKDYVEGLGMIYISTPFSRAAANFLEEIDVPAYKIGSGECDNIPLIEHIASFGKPIIMSTGMQTIETLRKSVDVLEQSGVEFALLECTNLYPSPAEIVSLAGVTELRNAFPDVPIGFSDHSIGPIMALSSVALGACILERHYTDTRYRKGPDISCSMDPAELKFLIDRSKEIHIAANNPKKRSSAEDDVYRFARSSVVAERELKAGTVLTKDDIWARRPGSGEISGNDFYDVVGKTLKVDLKRNQQLRWDDLV